jgi:hypothetical protein
MPGSLGGRLVWFRRPRGAPIMGDTAGAKRPGRGSKRWELAGATDSMTDGTAVGYWPLHASCAGMRVLATAKRVRCRQSWMEHAW